MILANIKTVIPLLKEEREELIEKLGNKYNKKNNIRRRNR